MKNMKRILFILTGFLLYIQQGAYAQRTITENFDGSTISFSVQNANFGTASWSPDSTYYVSSPKSYRGIVPSQQGDSVVLETPYYDFTNDQYVYLTFNQICKISPNDIARIEYKDDYIGSNWEPLLTAAYEGSGIYTTNGFNAGSYPEWDVNDNLAVPKQSWWKQEKFNISPDVKGFRYQFRFIIKKGSGIGSNFSYGWLIDNFQIVASPYEINIPVVEFIGTYVQDTVYSTGLYEINAKVKSTSHNPIDTPWIVYTQTLNNTTVKDSVKMSVISGDSIWRGTLPQFLAGSGIVYSITGRDGNNTATITSSYVIIKPIWKGITGNHYVGDPGSTTTVTHAPFNTYYNWGWSRMLVTPDELAEGLIESISFFPMSWGRTTLLQNQKLYFKLVPDAGVVAGFDDPDTNGAVLVWSGNIATNYLKVGQPMEIKLDMPFTFPKDTGLMIYWMNRDGIYNGQNSWKATGTSPSIKSIYVYVDDPTHFPDSTGTTGKRTGTSNFNRPNMSFYMTGSVMEDNSVALASIDSPVVGEATAGTPTPVTVTIRNRGDVPLSQVTIGWTVNGVQMPDTTWTANNPLGWDFQKQITIGSYMPGSGMNDTIQVWVSMPNGALDSVLIDDTSSIVVYGCQMSMAGRFVVGPGETYETIQEVIDLLELCVPGGDVFLALKSGTYTQNWNYSNFGSLMRGYKLWITSEADNADSVIVKPASGVGLTLNNTNNFGIHRITIDVTSGTYGVHFTGSCDNIDISHCKILSLPATASSSYIPVYKTNNTGILTNVRINNNLLDGGYYGIYMGARDKHLWEILLLTVIS